MTEIDFLNAVIDDGLAEVESTYLRPAQSEQRHGASQAFRDCQNKTIEEIVELSVVAKHEADTRRYNQVIEGYWYWRLYELQTEWIINVFWCMRYATGGIVDPAFANKMTSRGMIKVCDVLGIETSASAG